MGKHEGTALERRVRKTGSRKAGVARKEKDISKLLDAGCKVVFWEDALPKEIQWAKVWQALNQILGQLSYSSSENAEEALINNAKSTRDKKLKTALLFLAAEVKRIRKNIFPKKTIRQIQFRFSESRYEDDGWHRDTASLNKGEVRWIRAFLNRSTKHRIKRKGREYVIKPKTGVVSVHTRDEKHMEPEWKGRRFIEVIDLMSDSD